jgi:hypothetical protein
VQVLVEYFQHQSITLSYPSACCFSNLLYLKNHIQLMAEEYGNNNYLVWLHVREGAGRTTKGPYINTAKGRFLWTGVLRSCRIDESIIRRESKRFGTPKALESEIFPFDPLPKYRIYTVVEEHTEVSTRLHEGSEEFTMLYILRKPDMEDDKLAKYLHDQTENSILDFGLETFLDIAEAISAATSFVKGFCARSPSFKYLQPVFSPEKRDAQDCFKLLNLITAFKVETEDNKQEDVVRLFGLYVQTQKDPNRP